MQRSAPLNFNEEEGTRALTNRSTLLTIVKPLIMLTIDAVMIMKYQTFLFLMQYNNYY